MDIDTIQRNVAIVADKWSPERRARLGRRALDKADFAVLADAGLTLTGVPEEMGGVWHSVERSTRQTGEIFRTLARIDPSVALVATMHPSVSAFWHIKPPEPPMDPVAWSQQRDLLLTAAKGGHWIGTISSEPGGRGDLGATRARAGRNGDGSWHMTGEKHMGSGSGVTSFMMTVAVPEGEEAPDIFLLDARELPWDGSHGCTMIREWDGHGMAATQSHAFEFNRVKVARHGLGGDGYKKLVPLVGPFVVYLFASVIMGVLDAALAEGRRRLQPRAEQMSAFEKVSWTKAVNDIWLAQQAFEGMARAIERGAASPGVARGKIAIAELAEASLLSMSKAIGGASYSRSNPFGQWSQDVRALGFLRPPWALAYQGLFGISFAD
jgi:alkylation response protein AidB-like acyl-CoA dehydrogenase